MQIDLTLCISYVKHCVNWLIKLRTCMNHNFTGVTNLAPPMVKTVQLRHVVVAAVPKPRVGQALPLQKLFKEVCPVMGSNDHKTAPSTTGTLKSKIASNFLWSPCKEICLVIDLGRWLDCFFQFRQVLTDRKIDWHILLIISLKPRLICNYYSTTKASLKKVSCENWKKKII